MHTHTSVDEHSQASFPPNSMSVLKRSKWLLGLTVKDRRWADENHSERTCDKNAEHHTSNF